MRPEDDTSFLDRTGSEERAALERKWTNGNLAHHHEQVRRFILEQRTEILQLADGRRDTASLVAATQKLIATLRTVHHQSEMHDQMREIHNEIWYCGQRGEFDTKQITREWVARHGSNWRRWRIKEYQFVAGHCAAEIDAAIGNT
jgi:hypothetical protein